MLVFDNQLERCRIAATLRNLNTWASASSASTGSRSSRCPAGRNRLRSVACDVTGPSLAVACYRPC
eukprot:14107523-Alexandrium_andersonii.AAC.2